MIEQKVINDITKFIYSKIDKVVLNGNYQITDFIMKKITENIIVLHYLVPAADVSHITKIDLVGPDGVVSSNDVNIPMQADQRMIQEIEVEEG